MTEVEKLARVIRRVIEMFVILMVLLFGVAVLVGFNNARIESNHHEKT